MTFDCLDTDFWLSGHGARRILIAVWMGFRSSAGHGDGDEQKINVYQNDDWDSWTVEDDQTWVNFLNKIFAFTTK